VTSSAVERSFKERYGDRYFPVDESYDKRVYENTIGNYIRIILTLIVFWIFQGIHWWACFELGINWSPILMLYSICIFFFTLIVGAGLLTSGKFANKKKRLHNFLEETLAELKSKKLDEEEKAKQLKAYEDKVGGNAAALADEATKPNYAINEDENALIAENQA
jgi:amino acid permease